MNFLEQTISNLHHNFILAVRRKLRTYFEIFRQQAQFKFNKIV